MRGIELKVGDAFEMNDRRARIVGIAALSQGMAGSTYIYTTWDRAKDYAPNQRKMLHAYLGGAPAREITARGLPGNQ